ncbi:MAG: efflux RND transporter permease subunit [Planctomycetales bacterium]|nr:efflux RND transporter permease subunit [Planctomycetales bacterium]
MNALLHFSLRNRMLIVCLALITLVAGSMTMATLPIDIFPPLTRPRVSVMTECPGLSPEEVETLVTLPLEVAFNGATGVEAVRSSSGIGLSVIYVEFGWRTDIYIARQIVNERIALVRDRLPETVKPELAPISSIIGQIVMVGMYSRNGSTPPMEVRTLADWSVRPRLLTIPGVAQVITMGGGRKQYQVKVDATQLQAFEVTLEQVEQALIESNQNVTGGFLDRGSLEYLVRGIGRVQSIADLEQTVVKPHGERSVLLRDVARVVEGPQGKRGDASVNGHAAVVLTIAKQPTADTLSLTDQIEQALRELQSTLPDDIEIDSSIFQQRKFIDLGIHNVVDALRDGAVLVLIVLLLFLMNVRTTFITLTAIPLSIVITGLVFHVFGQSINVMTLGGLAVAMGELVDDAIVDIENVFRRLHQNARLAQPKPSLDVIYHASIEVRGCIVFGTMLVILVFLPLFALSGVEGRLFAPLGVAYIVSILASLLVSLTVTPVLGSLLLARQIEREGKRALEKATSGGTSTILGAEAHGTDSFLLRALKRVITPVIHLSMNPLGLKLILLTVFAAIIGSGVLVLSLGTDFLPPFDEGAAQVNIVLPPGSSLETSNRVCRMVDTAFRKHMAPLRRESPDPAAPVDHRSADQDQPRAKARQSNVATNLPPLRIPARSASDRDQETDDKSLIKAFVRRSGRAEMDEHAEGVNVTEYIVSMNPRSGVPRQAALALLRRDLEAIPGIEYEVEQPLAHLISHMLSGVSAQIAIKVFGDDLDRLRKTANEIKAAITGIPGLAPPVVEAQTMIPQLRIELNREQLGLHGLTPGHVNRLIETALNGRTVSTILEGSRTFDLVVRMDDEYRTDVAAIRRLAIDLPSGGQIPLEAVARVYDGAGPNTISHERTQRRITIRGNTTDGDLGSVVAAIQAAVKKNVELPAGYFIEYGGQFEAQQEATRLISLLSLVSLAGVFLVLFTQFPAARIVLQIMFALPTAFVGGTVALWLTGQTLTVASMVGFISLGGIAARNGILLVAHYLHLLQEEGEEFTEAMILRGSLERLAPVLMTALTAGIGLVPLVLGGQQPGKEILYPVATVILGGLVTSTVCEYVVHPGLFWRFSGNSAKRLSQKKEGF